MPTLKIANELLFDKTKPFYELGIQYMMMWKKSIEEKGKVCSDYEFMKNEYLPWLIALKQEIDWFNWFIEVDKEVLDEEVPENFSDSSKIKMIEEEYTEEVCTINDDWDEICEEVTKTRLVPAMKDDEPIMIQKTFREYVLSYYENDKKALIFIWHKTIWDCRNEETKSEELYCFTDKFWTDSIYQVNYTLKEKLKEYIEE